MCAPYLFALNQFTTASGPDDIARSGREAVRASCPPGAVAVTVEDAVGNEEATGEMLVVVGVEDLACLCGEVPREEQEPDSSWALSLFCGVPDRDVC